MRASSGIASPARPSGKPLPSQRSSSARIARAVASGSSSCAPRRHRARSAAGDLAHAAAGEARHVDHAARAGQGAVARTHVARDVGGEGEPGAAVHQRALLLDDPVVAAEQRRDVRSVRRAAGVLEQQRVVERRAVVGREVERRGEAHAHDAGPSGMAQGLPFGEIERDRKAS